MSEPMNIKYHIEDVNVSAVKSENIMTIAFMNRTLTDLKYAAIDKYNSIKNLAACLISLSSLPLRFFRSYNLTAIKFL